MTNIYCDHFNVTLVTEENKRLAFGPQDSLNMYYDKLTSHININDKDIQFASKVEHVGVLRSVHGNQPSLLARFTAHRKAIFSILPVGLARGHRGNPATSMRVERIYGAPSSSLGSVV